MENKTFFITTESSTLFQKEYMSVDERNQFIDFGRFGDKLFFAKNASPLNEHTNLRNNITDHGHKTGIEIKVIKEYDITQHDSMLLQLKLKEPN